MSLSHLRCLNGYFYFRIRVPSDLLHHFGYPEIQKSLKTTSVSLAKSRGKVLASSAEYLFGQIRSGLLDDHQVVQLIEKVFPSRKTRLAKAERPKLLQEIKEAYVKEHVVLGKWTEKTKQEVESALSLAVEILGNRLLNTIDRGVMVEYLSKLQRLPANLKKSSEYRDLSIAQVLEKDIHRTMGQRTINKYVGRVSSLFIWCIRREYMQWNPAQGLTTPIEAKAEEERKAYTKDDLKKLIHSLGKVKKGAPERYFVPLIAMYSGARLSEICQLYVNDIKQLGNVWCFDINDNADKRLKNKASRRVIPLHPELVRLGLLDHVEEMKTAGAPRLWMTLGSKRDGYGHDFSKWYQRFNRKHITKDPKKVFHSFRHTVADTLKQKGVPEGVIAEILGHANQSITTGRYGKRFRPEILLEALKKLEYGV
jgi:integrase